MRIYNPYSTIFQALYGSNIQLMLGVANSDLQALATDASAATQWVLNNVKRYSTDVKFRYIAVGNEVQVADPESQYVLRAMQNIHNALVSAGLKDQIKVSTAIDLRLLDLGNISPPSRGAFTANATSYIDPIIAFLVNNGLPILSSVYPYFTYINNMQKYQLHYAIFTSPGVVEQDGDLGYTNLFHAMLDALYWALEKAGGSNLEIVVSESGWPSAGDSAATIENAGTYYTNLINHLKEGTPKRPGRAIETYLFAMFDENRKTPEVEKHFGIFYPNKQPKYQIKFP